MDQKCPICDNLAKIPPTTAHKKDVTCLRCGQFTISSSAENYFKKTIEKDKTPYISSYIRHGNLKNITSENWKALQNISIPSIGEKATILLQCLAKEETNPGTDLNSIYMILKKHESNMPFIIPYMGICWAANISELIYIVDKYLIETKEYIKSYHIQKDRKFQITPNGWAYLESLKQLNPDSKLGFIAMWFSPQTDNLNTAIHKGITDAGYNPIRVDNHEHSNKIDDEIIALIKQSKFIVADFTGHRGGVYFEAGYAMALGLKVIWTVKKDDLKNIHFDIRQYNFIQWSDDALDEFSQQIKNRINAII